MNMIDATEKAFTVCSTYAVAKGVIEDPQTNLTQKGLAIRAALDPNLDAIKQLGAMAAELRDLWEQAKINEPIF